MSYDGLGFCGLNKWAEGFVAKPLVLAYVETIIRKYPDGREETIGPRDVMTPWLKEEETGLLADDGVPLNKYTSPNGEVYTEHVQEHTIADSYGVIFLCLKDKHGGVISQSLWSEEEKARICNRVAYGEPDVTGPAKTQSRRKVLCT